MRRCAVTLAALLAGCLGATETKSPVIPDGTPVYRIDESQLFYAFRDTSAGRDIILSWLNTPTVAPLLGYNCLGMLPDGLGDSTGTFIFAWNGPNTGFVERWIGTTADTAVAYFFPPEGSDQGTEGSYVVNSAGELTLNWANGIQSRYFQPGAILTFRTDTIVSVVDVLSRGDSIREQWRVVWTLEGQNGC